MPKLHRIALWAALMWVAQSAWAAPQAGEANASANGAAQDSDAPAQSDAARPSARDKAPAGASRYRQWTTEQGVPMLAVDPSATPHDTVSICDNGRRVAAERGESACREQ